MVKVLFAIDLLDGRCVRLERGDFQKVKIYSENPLALLQNMIERGARDFHIIDLNGARNGNPFHVEIIKKMREMTRGYIEVGGGIRRVAIFETYVACGINGLIVGTEAFEGKLLRELGRFEKLILGLDILNGSPMIKGWKEKAQKSTDEIISLAEEKGVMALLVTSIKKDGMLSGPDFDLIEQIMEKTKLPIIASGGITSSEDIKRLKELGVFGVVVGKAIYEERIKIEEAILYTD